MFKRKIFYCNMFYLYGAVEETIVLPGSIEQAFRAGKAAVVLPMR